MTIPSYPPQHARHTPHHRYHDWMGFISGLCLILAVIFAFQFAWQYYGSGLDYTQTTNTHETASKTSIPITIKDKTVTLNPTNPPVETEPAYDTMFGWIFLPDIDRTWSRPIREGTDANVLDTLGAGHYKTTPMPGGKGNSAYAGHDTINDFGLTYQLKPGHTIIIRTSEHWYVYKVTSTKVVTSKDTWVLNADTPGAERGITLTTCWPMFTPTDTGERFITWGRFIGWANVKDGVPEQLAESKMSSREKLTRQLITTTEQYAMPITGVMTVSLLAIWLLINAILWLFCWKRMINVWRKPSWNPIIWLWRLQAGPVNGSTPVRILSGVLRSILFIILWASIMFAWWRWGAHWLPEWFPQWFAAPHPTL